MTGYCNKILHTMNGWMGFFSFLGFADLIMGLTSLLTHHCVSILSETSYEYLVPNMLLLFWFFSTIKLTYCN